MTFRIMKVLNTKCLSPLIHSLAVITAGVITLTLSACQDDRLWDDNYCPEGQPATVTVPLTLGDVREVTRGELGEGLDKTVTSLWIGVYNVASGARTGYHECSADELGVFENFHTDKSVTLDTWSGRSYIVAVANYEYRPGTDSDGKLGNLADRLSEADSWEKFISIAAAFDDVCGINQEAPLNALLMSGSYSSEEHTDGSMTEIEPVNIQPGMNALGGKIHLRRMISQVKFNVEFNTANIVSAEITSWRVRNIPVAAWLMERPDIDAAPNCTDAFAVTARNSDDNVRFRDGNIMTDVTNNSKNSGSTKIIAYAFDFWQLENKKTGITPEGKTYTVTENGTSSEKAYDNNTAYKWRDREYKTDGENTGKYMSLVESAESESLNNMATFVEINVSMEMSVNEEGTQIESGHRRLVETRYIVHLGYCEGSDNMKKATDFNCRRNTKYTYNVTINNVKDLVVEAKKEGEVNPAAEGLITDISDDYYELDAHYGAFNVHLNKTELSGFQFYIVAYDENGAEVTIDSNVPSSIPKSGDKKFKYLSWVEMRYSNDNNPNILAAYKPRTGTNSDGKTYTLSEISEKQGDGLTEGYYTVFVNEYVYETSADGNEKGSTAWWGYVNRPPRRAWINVTGSISSDGETTHYTSKYALSQRSIQTYYRVGTGASESGLGVEHINETEGLNLRNNFNRNRDNKNAGHSNESGRYNLAQYLTGQTKANSLSWSNVSRLWSKYINQSALQSVNEMTLTYVDPTDDKLTHQNLIYRAGRTEYIPALVLLSKKENDKDDFGHSIYYNNDNISSGWSELDPDQTSNAQYIEAIASCMNRNRDLDGDGYIDANELRWVVPTRAQLLRLVLGRRSLETPVLNVDNITNMPFPASTNGYNAPMLYYTSDGHMMWLMEGVSDSWWRGSQGNNTACPWQVRCIRNLGTNFTEIKNENPTQPAFYRENNSNIINLERYEARSLREEPYRSSDNHMPNHHLYDQRYNRCYRKFEFAPSVIHFNNLGITDRYIKISDYLRDNNPCKSLETSTGKNGWRVPNQKELTIIASVGAATQNINGATYQLTCTFNYFDNKGYVFGANPDNSWNAISSDYRYVMKVASEDGHATQWGTKDASYDMQDKKNTFGIRCVRDVLD